MIRSSGTLASAGSLSFANVEMPADINLSRHVDNKPKVRLFESSEMKLLALRPEGKPPRKTWDANAAFASTSNSLFRLKAVDLPNISTRDTFDTEYRKDAVFEHLKSQLTATRFVEDEVATKAAASVTPPLEKTRTRSQKYYDLLMKNYDNRVDKWTHDDETESRDKAIFAQKYFDRTAKQEAIHVSVQTARTHTSTSSSDDERASKKTKLVIESRPHDCFLQAWDGQMQIDIEVVIIPAPGLEDSDDDKDSAEASTPSSSGGFSSKKSSRKPSLEGADGAKGRKTSKGKGSASGDEDEDDDAARADLYEELERLKEEMGADQDEKQSQNSDDMPEGLKLKRLQNIWDNPKPKWSLGIGGTVFFVPDAERYAMGSSLPPPPPPSLHGRHRIHLKPRLPLEISNHRYRDEHPNIWPDVPYSPEVQDYSRFEEKLMTLDFYKSCQSAMTQLPQMEKASDAKKHRAKFGAMVERETQKSVAWKNWRHRETLKKKEAAQKAKEEQELATARAKEAAKAAADAANAAALAAAVYG